MQHVVRPLSGIEIAAAFEEGREDGLLESHPGGERGIAVPACGIRFLNGDHAARARQRDHLVQQFLIAADRGEHKAHMGEVE